MNLSQAARLSRASTIALVGAGGKTTAMFQLARELAPALLTTTTHLGVWQTPLADRHFIWEQNAAMPEMAAQVGTGLTLVTGPAQDERYEGLSPGQMETLHEAAVRHALPLLIEADGAHQKALKAPAGHEPAIPNFADTAVVVAGLSALGELLTDQTVHRAKIFSTLIGAAMNQPITAKQVIQELIHPQGGLKNIPAGARRVVLLNQADTSNRQAQAGQVATSLLSVFDSVIIASLQTQKIFSVHEPVAGIVLAAGESSRFGKPKQLLDYHGQPFVRKVTQTALDAGLSPVTVVTGAHAGKIETIIQDLPALIIRNKNWENGQSTSIQAGLGALPPRSGAAVFLLADQPQVTPHVIRALVERHATRRAAIVAPLAADRRTNPVLFDRSTFEDLHAITGDVGGRAIFSRYKVDYLPWQDESLLLDVDTEADYQKLLAWGVKD